MKKLICEKDVELLQRQGEKYLYADHDTLVTTAAKDLARHYRIEITDDPARAKSGKPAAAQTANKTDAPCTIDSEELFSHLMAAVGK